MGTKTDCASQVLAISCGIIVFLVMIAHVAVERLHRLSINPLKHMSQALSSCFDTAVYVAGSDSVYLDSAIRYKGERMLVQPLLISPTNPLNIFIIMSLSDEFRDLARLYPINQEKQQFITMTRLNITNWDAISCDFCSIYNGYFHWLQSALTVHPDYISQLPADRIKRIHALLDTLASSVTMYINSGHPWSQETAAHPGNVPSINQYAQCTDALSKITQIMNNIEVIELRYCPFKAFAQYYRNTDSRYLPLSRQAVMQAGKVIQQQPTIECFMCSQRINTDVDRSLLREIDKKSPMYKLMIYVTKHA